MGNNADGTLSEVHQGVPEGGLNFHMASQLGVGHKVVPRVSVWVRMGGTDAENHQDPYNRIPESKKPLEQI